MTADAYNEAVLEDEPVLYWPCEDASGTTLLDASGNGNDGTITGNATLGYTASYLKWLLPHNQIVSLDLNRTGTRNGYAYIDPVPAEWPTTAATFEMWYLDTTYSPTPDGAGIFSYCTGAANTGNDWLFWWDVEKEYQLHVDESATSDGFEAGGVSPYASVSAPKHLVVTWDGVTGTACLYINGNLVETLQKAAWIATLTGGGAFVVGQDQDDVLSGFTAAQAFAAVVSNIAVYNTVLPAARVKAHWDAHVDSLAYPAYDATPALESAGAVDSTPPVITQLDWLVTNPASSDAVTVRVTDNVVDALDVEIWAVFPTVSHLIYANESSTSGYSVVRRAYAGTGNNDAGYEYGITPLNAGWVGSFTLTVVARDDYNKTTESFTYTLSDADEYPPHMDPYT